MCGIGQGESSFKNQLVFPLKDLPRFAVAHLFYILSLPPNSLLGRRPVFGFSSAAALFALAAAIWHFFLRCQIFGASKKEISILLI